MENKLITIADIKPSVKTNIDLAKEKLLKVVEECPFVEITDNKTYDTAKKNRTALLSASTATEKEGKEVNKKIKEITTYVTTEYTELAKITREPYDKQQDEVKRYEQILENERLEKQRLAEERAEKIKQSIVDYEAQLISVINTISYDNRESVKIDIERLIEAKKGSFEEFEVLYEASVDKIENLVESKVKEVVDAYNAEQDKKRIQENNAINTTLSTLSLEISRLSVSNKDFKSIEQKIVDFKSQNIIFEANSDLHKSTCEQLNVWLQDKIKEVERLEQIEKEAAEQRAENERLQREQREREEKQAAEKLEAEKQNKYQARVIKLLTFGFKNVDNDFIFIHDKLVDYSLTLGNDFVMDVNDEVFESNLKKLEDRLNAPDVVEVPEVENIPETVQNNTVEAVEVEQPKEGVETTETVEVFNSEIVFKALIVEALSNVDADTLAELKNAFYYGNGKEEILKAFALAIPNN